MYESELQNLRAFEGAALREALRSPELAGVFSNYDDSYLISVEILQTLIGDIENNSTIEAETFRYPLFKAFFELGLDVELLSTYIESLFNSIYSYVKKKIKYNTRFIELLNRYQRVISGTLLDSTYSGRGYSLSGVEEYKTSVSNTRIAPLTKNVLTREIQTLFPYTRYWYPPEKRVPGSYSPIQLNKTENSYTPVSKNKKVFKLSYDKTTVYQGNVYLKKPNTKVNEDKFEERDWSLFVPKKFNASKSFNQVYSNLLEGVYLSISENAQSINSITSDSKVKNFSPKYDQVLKDKDLLINSFGGAGRSVYEKLIELRFLSSYMGGYEGSPVGSVSYVSKFIEYLDFVTTGKLSRQLKQENYGVFNLVFPTSIDSLGNEEGINGLRFLEGFSQLRSFSHNQVVPVEVDLSKDRLSYNPIYARFKSGFTVNDAVYISRKTNDEVDFISLSLENLLQKSIFLGDKLERTANSLNKYGQLSGYENLGSLSFQLAEFQKIFPPTVFINTTQSPGGFTGSISHLHESYDLLSQSLTPLSLPPSMFTTIVRWLELISKSLKDVQYELTSLGIKTSGMGYLPNIETKKFISSSPDLIKYLSFLGFRDSEINQVLGVKSFPELISKFAPLSDSADLSSFFKGFELSQLIYEFGGEDGINAYLEFLYKKSTVDKLLNVLSLTEKNKSDQTFNRINKYPRLIALLLGLSYAIDPEQLSKFFYLLGDNNIDLLDSISLLLQSNQTTIIKKKEDISLLEGVVSQLIGGYYPEDVYLSPDSDYKGAKEISPIGLKSWTEIIDSSLGNSGDLSKLYDKSIGLTIKELLTLLNNPSPTSGIGQIVDNFSGGDFTKILRYANISGLATKLGYYKNSSQLNNKKIDFDETYNSLPSVLDNLNKVIQSTDLTIKLITSAINRDWSSNYYKKPDLMQPIINSQNKPTDVMVSVISDKNSLTSSSINQRISRATPQDPPGIGNSRLPNRVSIPDSLTPEQARALSTSPSKPFTQGVVDFSAKSLLTRFIKVTERNLILSNISSSSEADSLYGGKSVFGTLGDNSRKETIADLSNEDILLYKELRNQDINNSGSGRNFIANPEDDYESGAIKRVPKELLSEFNPVESCKKFGGTNCESIETPPKCVGILNKSSTPENYSLSPFNDGLVVDRPLGYFSEYLPSEGDIINNKLPSYYSLLDSPVPGRESEGIMRDLSVDPIVIKRDPETGDMVDYANTQFAITEFTRLFKKEYTELTCTSFSQTHLYQICMNLLKCKRFRVRNDGKDTRIRFCPPGTSGGKRVKQ